MTNVLEGQDFTDAATFVAALNKARLAQPRSWITYVGTVAGKEVRIKTYDTGYLQILEVAGVKHGAPMDMKPTAWKACITDAINRGS